MELLDHLEAGFRELVNALDGQDPERIIIAAEAIRPLVSEIEKTGVWHDNHALKAQLIALSNLIDAARFRVNKLTNLNKQRANNLSYALGMGISHIYKKHP